MHGRVKQRNIFLLYEKRDSVSIEAIYGSVVHSERVRDANDKLIRFTISESDYQDLTNLVNDLGEASAGGVGGGAAGQGRRGSGQGMAGHGDQGGQDMWPTPATIPASVVASRAFSLSRFSVPRFFVFHINRAKGALLSVKNIFAVPH